MVYQLTERERRVNIASCHVHNIYDRIAPHFSCTRHSGWPQVTKLYTKYKK